MKRYSVFTNLAFQVGAFSCLCLVLALVVAYEDFSFSNSTGAGYAPLLPTRQSTLLPSVNKAVEFANSLPEPHKSCVLERTSKFSAEEYNRLPDLGIVLTVSQDYVNDDILMGTVHNFEIWAAKQGYHFHLAVIKTNDWLKLRGNNHTLQHFFTARWNHMREMYWNKYKWLLHVDSDVLVLRMDNNINKWLASEEEIIAHYRENYELSASAVLMRTTPFARCFFDHWLSLGTLPRSVAGNHDNGDLIQAVMDFIAPETADKCGGLRVKWHYRDFVKCFHTLQASLANADEWSPFRLINIHGGFWRTFGKPRKPDPNDTYVYAGGADECSYKHDVLGHGWKRMSVVYAANRQNSTFAFQAPLPARCKDMSEAKAMDIAMKCCHVHYHGCMLEGVNLCLEGASQAHCRVKTYDRKAGC